MDAPDALPLYTRAIGLSTELSCVPPVRIPGTPASPDMSKRPWRSGSLAAKLCGPLTISLTASISARSASVNRNRPLSLTERPYSYCESSVSSRTSDAPARLCAILYVKSRARKTATTTARTIKSGRSREMNLATTTPIIANQEPASAQATRGTPANKSRLWRIIRVSSSLGRGGARIRLAFHPARLAHTPTNPFAQTFPNALFSPNLAQTPKTHPISAQISRLKHLTQNGGG